MKPQTRRDAARQPGSLGERRSIVPEWLLLVVVVGAIYFARLSEPNLRGEETRRGRVAVEMMQTGDWIVPRQQGHLFLSRPPLQNWLIAAAGYVRSGVDDLAIRLPSVLAILATTLLIYGYARTCVSPVAALVSGLAFATMIQVLVLGRLGETEALFTLAVGGSLLMWHWGWTRSWSPYVTWGLAYVLVACGMLLKGPQAPVFFASPVGLYLIAMRQWRSIVTWPHACGILIFVGLWNAWQIPYFLAVGGDATREIYSHDVALRFVDRSWLTLLTHVAAYPLEIAAGLLPWSPLLLVACRGSFWNWLGKSRPHAIFLLCCLVATFPTCWFTPGARGRYYMPLCPCFAVLIGLVAEHCWQSASSLSRQSGWRRFMVCAAVAMGLAVPAAIALQLLPQTAAFALPWSLAVSFAVLALLLAGAAWWSAAGVTPLQRQLGPLALASFVALAYIGPATNIRTSISNDTARQVAALKGQLPEGVRLVSLGRVDHMFTYYYEQPIKPLEEATGAQTLPDDAEYFCYLDNRERLFDFPWEQVAAINCDRNRRAEPERVVVVARRLRGSPVATVAGHEPITESSPAQRR